MGRVRCNCGKYLSSREETVICPDCGAANSTIAKAPESSEESGRGRGGRRPRRSRGQDDAEQERGRSDKPDKLEEPQLRGPDGAVLRYSPEEEEKRKDEFAAIIDRLKNIGRR